MNKKDKQSTTSKGGAPKGNQNAIGNTGGQPTKYKPGYAVEAYELCLLGATDKELAEEFEVCEDTINEWKKAHPEFTEALKKGKRKADAKVAAALYKRAIGFNYDEVTFERMDMGEDLSEEDIKKALYKKKVVTKMVVPDTGAAMNWLKNRQREIWRDNMEIDFNKLSDEQLDKLIERLTAKANAA